MRNFKKHELACLPAKRATVDSDFQDVQRHSVTLNSQDLDEMLTNNTLFLTASKFS